MNDEGQSLAELTDSMRVHNPELYLKKYRQSEKIARMYYWFYERIPNVVDSDAAYNRFNEPITVIG